MSPSISSSTANAVPPPAPPPLMPQNPNLNHDSSCGQKSSPPVPPPLSKNGPMPLKSSSASAKEEPKSNELPFEELPKYKSVSLKNLAQAKKFIPKIKQYALSEGGGFGGVCFCLSSKEQRECLFVCKGTASPAEELFANQLMQFFHLECPNCFLVEYQPKDRATGHIWEMIKKKLMELSEGDVDQERIEKAFERAFFLLMEYQDDTVSLDGVSLEEVGAVFAQEEVLYSMGRMIVMDILMNNWDRFPLEKVMEHDGNPGNILFRRRLKDGVEVPARSSQPTTTNNSSLQQQKGEFQQADTMSAESSPPPTATPPSPSKTPYNYELVCIDQAIFAVRPENEAGYIERIEEFLQTVARTGKLQRVAAFIETETGYKLSQRQQSHMIRGIWDSIDYLKEKLPQNEAFTILSSMKKEVEAMKTGEDWKDVYQNSIDAINVKFLTDVLERLRVFRREDYTKDDEEDR